MDVNVLGMLASLLWSMIAHCLVFPRLKPAWRAYPHLSELACSATRNRDEAVLSGEEPAMGGKKAVIWGWESGLGPVIWG